MAFNSIASCPCLSSIARISAFAARRVLHRSKLGRYSLRAILAASSSSRSLAGLISGIISSVNGKNARKLTRSAGLCANRVNFSTTYGQSIRFLFYPMARLFSICICCGHPVFIQDSASRIVLPCGLWFVWVISGVLVSCRMYSASVDLRFLLPLLQS